MCCLPAVLAVMAKNWKKLTTLHGACMRRFSDSGIAQLAAGCPGWDAVVGLFVEHFPSKRLLLPLQD